MWYEYKTMKYFSALPSQLCDLTSRSSLLARCTCTILMVSSESIQVKLISEVFEKYLYLKKDTISYKARKWMNDCMSECMAH